MTTTCGACGKEIRSGTSIDSVMLCKTCAVDVADEMKELLTSGKRVSAPAIARRIFREEHSVTGYLLRDIPEELWTEAKHKAVDNGMTMREMNSGCTPGLPKIVTRLSHPKAITIFKWRVDTTQ